MHQLILLVDIVTLLYAAFPEEYFIEELCFVRVADVGIVCGSYIQHLELWEGRHDRFDDRHAEHVVGNPQFLDQGVETCVKTECGGTLYAHYLQCASETGEQKNGIPSSSVHDWTGSIQLPL